MAKEIKKSKAAKLEKASKAEKSVKSVKAEKAIVKADKVAKAPKAEKAAKVSVKSDKAPKADKVAKADKAVKSLDKGQVKVQAALDASKIKVEKIKTVDGITNVIVSGALTAKQFSKVKTVSGRKALLAPKGENWMLTYQ